MIKTNNVMAKSYLNVLGAYAANLVTKKKKGDDKLVVALILIAVGVVLCIAFRNQVITMVTSAFATLSTKMTEIFSSVSIS